MLAGQIVSRREVRLIEVDEPVLPAADELPGMIVFQPEMTCLCGSDLPYFDSDFEGHAIDYPLPAGMSLHEMVGTIVRTNGHRWKPGTRVLAVPIGQRGLLERYVLSEQRVVALDERLSDEIALLAQPFGTVVWALKKLPNMIDRDVVVLGLGPIGQMFIAGLRNMGARRIIGVDPVIDRTVLGRQMGATDVIPTEGRHAVDEVRRILHGALADVVVEAVGHKAHAFNEAILLARDHGEILCFGVPPIPTDGVQLKEAMLKNLTIRTSLHPDFERTFPLAMQWLGERRVDLSPLLTHRFPLTQIQHAFDLFRDRNEGAIKVLVEFSARKHEGADVKSGNISDEHASRAGTQFPCGSSSVDDIVRQAMTFWNRSFAGPSGASASVDAVSDDGTAIGTCGPVWALRAAAGVPLDNTPNESDRISYADWWKRAAVESAFENPSGSSNGLGHCPVSFSVTLTFPGLSVNTFLKCCGPRLMVWPNGVPSGRRISIVSSGLSKRKDTQREWFDALRTSVLRSLGADELLCVAEGTAAAAAVVRASQLFGVPLLHLHVADDMASSPQELVTWLQRFVDSPLPMSDSLECRVLLSPKLAGAAAGGHLPDEDTGDPDRDVAVFAAAERLTVLSCRSGGRIERLCTRHLTDVSRKSCAVLMASMSEREQPVFERLVSLGAVPWLLHKAREVTAEQSAQVPTELPDWCPASGLQTSAAPLVCPDQWLCHWTRPQYGAWQDQDESDFWDELILGCDSADRSAVATVLRILNQRKVLPSAFGSSDQATVSLTAVPLSQFRKRRIYRGHRQRYDFEPWGIAVRRSIVEQSGACPVVYLRCHERPDTTRGRYFHPASDSSGKIDWSAECEWRIAGCLELKSFGPHDLYVFVNSPDEVHIVQSCSAWPVFALPPE